MEQIGIEGKRTRFEALDNALRHGARSRGTPGDKQGKEMLLGRMSACRFRRAVTIVDQRIGVGRSEALLQPTGKGVDVLNGCSRSLEAAQSRRLCVVWPDPMIRMPSSVSG